MWKRKEQPSANERQKGVKAHSFFQYHDHRFASVVCFCFCLGFYHPLEKHGDEDNNTSSSIFNVSAYNIFCAKALYTTYAITLLDDRRERRYSLSIIMWAGCMNSVNVDRRRDLNLFTILGEIVCCFELGCT